MFRNKLFLEYIDGAEWFVRGGLSFQFADGSLLEVPDGFKTDLASIPKIIWSICPPQGTPRNPVGRAAVGHDYLFATQTCSFAEANLKFKEMMIADRVTDYEEIYLAVKFGAHAAWNEDQVKYSLQRSPVGCQAV